MFKSLALANKAEEDYKQARGTAHKQLLQFASKHLRIEILHQANLIKKREADLAQIEQERDLALRKELSAHLVRSYLMNVPGIGQSRFDAIISRIFKGELSDLHKASWINGIGTQTQWEIDKWIKNYEQQIPHLMLQDFPGKQKIVSDFRAKESKLKTQISDYTKKKDELLQISEPVEKELLWLGKIYPTDFKRTLQDEVHFNPEIDRYISGVFSEWEQIPDWFRRAISASGQKIPTSLPAARIAVGASDGPTIIGTWKEVFEWPMVLIPIIILACFIGFMGRNSFFGGQTDTSTPTSTPLPMTTTASNHSPTIIPSLTSTPTMTPTVTVTSSPSPTNSPSPTHTPSPSTVPSTTPILRYVLNPTNLRSGPGTEFEVVKIVGPDEPLIYLEINDQKTWYRVALSNDVEGWISSTMLVPIEE